MYNNNSYPIIIAKLPSLSILTLLFITRRSLLLIHCQISFMPVKPGEKVMHVHANQRWCLNICEVSMVSSWWCMKRLKLAWVLYHHVLVILWRSWSVSCRFFMDSSFNIKSCDNLLHSSSRFGRSDNCCWCFVCPHSKNNVLAGTITYFLCCIAFYVFSSSSCPVDKASPSYFR